MAGSPASHNSDMVYTTYIDATTGDLVLAERQWSMPTPVQTVTLQNSSSATDKIYYPRIAAPATYDYTVPGNTEPVSVVVSSTAYSGTPPTEVNCHYAFDPVGGLFNSSIVSSSYAGGQFSGDNCSMPIVTGAGMINSADYTNAGGTPFNEYPILFYSDDGYSSPNGDFFASSFGPSTYIPGSACTATWFQVNFPVLNNAFDMINTPKPLVAAATSTNSNFDLLVSYWNGNGIYWKDMGGASAYSFKPGKPNNISAVVSNGYSLYPNPVKNTLNIKGADGAHYVVQDMLGRSLASGKLNGKLSTVDAAGLSTGMYMIQLSKDGHTENVKFVKE